MTTNHHFEQKQLFVSMFQEIFTLLSKLHRISEDLLTEAESDITHSCWTILSIIHCEPEPLTVPQIAQLRSTSRQAVQRQISLLLENGYIEAIDNPHNKRSPLYQVTVEGAAYYQNLRTKVYGQWLADVANIVGVEQAEQFLASIRVLDEALNIVSLKRREQETKIE
ncbi:MarR family winged helix-turn-helix transcriptional regulator [Ignatzschineria cameli]|uniref:HTH marR-type domain-containing protein n=2 Tax=Bacteria TaxID=2 RepID=A0A2U2ARF3_9GAMM|nr:MarR family transcriptional regulator [Ignatzschineria cameli]PWD83516.1 hypothetical protein DC080_08430 [Ignatzschineria cameli]PWD86841.1 hypothetical protein DC077_03225 [Ignatzschineria cameli]PWD91815.1 hypothetical protein DC079_00160 [Ignatzschineria cameli]PWD93599.1 hypothetical protein DC081_02025 [Ignatzschineria cameli]PWD94341.1 hypothetical protein DC078_02025 [Ignatzschineria cameli]